MTEMDVVSADHGGFSVTSNSAGSQEQLVQNLNVGKAAPSPEDTPDLKKAASDLGKKGGKAAAEKREEQKAALEAEKKAQGTIETDEHPEEEAEPEEKDAPKPTEKETEEEPEKLGKPRHDPKARMLEATRKEAEAKREAAKAREETKAAIAERDRIKAELEAAKAPPKPVEAPSKPTREQFQTDGEFFEALADWKAEEKVTKFKQEQEHEQRAKAFYQNLDDRLGKGVAARNKYKETDPDFESKVSDEVKTISNKLSELRDMHEPLESHHVVADEILNAEDLGPPLQIHLTNNPEDLQRILALRTTQEIQVEMRILARTLKRAATTATAPTGEVSKAPPPVRPVTGAPHNIAEEGHTPERAAKGNLDEYARGWKPAQRR